MDDIPLLMLSNHRKHWLADSLEIDADDDQCDDGDGGGSSFQVMLLLLFVVGGFVADAAVVVVGFPEVVWQLLLLLMMMKINYFVDYEIDGTTVYRAYILREYHFVWYLLLPMMKPKILRTAKMNLTHS